MITSLPCTPDKGTVSSAFVPFRRRFVHTASRRHSFSTGSGKEPRSRSSMTEAGVQAVKQSEGTALLQKLALVDGQDLPDQSLVDSSSAAGTTGTSTAPDTKQQPQVDLTTGSPVVAASPKSKTKRRPADRAVSTPLVVPLANGVPAPRHSHHGTAQTRNPYAMYPDPAFTIQYGVASEHFANTGVNVQLQHPSYQPRLQPQPAQFGAYPPSQSPSYPITSSYPPASPINEYHGVAHAQTDFLPGPYWPQHMYAPYTNSYDYTANVMHGTTYYPIATGIDTPPSPATATIGSPAHPTFAPEYAVPISPMGWDTYTVGEPSAVYSGGLMSLPSPVAHVSDPSVLQQLEDGAVLRRTGIIKFFDLQKGFGFIVDDQVAELAGRDIFVHYTAILMKSGFRCLHADEAVEYDLVKASSGGFQALNVCGAHGRPLRGLQASESARFAISDKLRVRNSSPPEEVDGPIVPGQAACGMTASATSPPDSSSTRATVKQEHS